MLVRCSSSAKIYPIFRKLLSTTSVLDAYTTRINTNELTYDEKQYAIVKLLQKVQNNIESTREINTLANQEAMYPRGVYIWGSVGTGSEIGKFLINLTYLSTLPRENTLNGHFLLNNKN
jgi:predicted ATPase